MATHLICAAGIARADALSEPPPGWRGRIQPVAEVDVSAADLNAREAIIQARAKVDELLRTEQVKTEDAVEAVARVCALYQQVKIDAAAGQCWDSARALAPNDYRWTYYAGYFALVRGQSERALQLLQSARELKPDYAPVDLRLGQALLDTNALEPARKSLERAAEVPGLRGAALYYLGQIDLLQRDYAGAERHLTEALAIHPDGAEIHYPLAQAYRHLGKEQEARDQLALFKHGTPAADDPLVAELEQVLAPAQRDFKEGLQAIRRQDYAAAVTHFEQGLKADPDNLAAGVSYARALFLNGRSDAAQAQLQSILKRDPDHLLANLFMGLLQQAHGETKQAAEHYRRMLKTEPANDGANFFLGNLLFSEAQYADAAQHYATALKANDAIPPALLLEAVALRRAGHADGEVAVLLEQRIEKHPRQVELQYALILLRSLSTDAAVRDGERALELANSMMAVQPMPPAVEAQALALAATGRFEDAAKAQRQLIDRLTWMVKPQQMQSMRDALADYEAGKMPDRDAWPEDDVLLGPGSFDALAQFRDYPVAKPY